MRITCNPAETARQGMSNAACNAQLHDTRQHDRIESFFALNPHTHTQSLSLSPLLTTNAPEARMILTMQRSRRPQGCCSQCRMARAPSGQTGSALQIQFQSRFPGQQSHLHKQHRHQKETSVNACVCVHVCPCVSVCVCVKVIDSHTPTHPCYQASV